MAVNKAKLSVHPAQPQPQHANTTRAGDPKSQRPRLNPEPTELMPVRAHIYRTIADVNGGLEHAIEGLQTLQKINYLRSGTLDGMHDLICRVRAQANLHLMTTLNEREMANAGRYQRLYLESEKHLPVVG